MDSTASPKVMTMRNDVLAMDGYIETMCEKLGLDVKNQQIQSHRADRQTHCHIRSLNSKMRSRIDFFPPIWKGIFSSKYSART